MAFLNCWSSRNRAEFPEPMEVATESREISRNEEDPTRSCTCKKASTIFLALALAGLFIALGATAVLTWPVAIGCAVGICVAFAILYGLSESCCCNKDSHNAQSYYNSYSGEVGSSHPLVTQTQQSTLLQPQCAYMQPGTY